MNKTFIAFFMIVIVFWGCLESVRSTKNTPVPTLPAQENIHILITNTTMINAIEEISYSHTFSTLNGLSNFIWSLENAPGWLTIDTNTGMLSGTAPLRSSKFSPYQFMVKVKDAQSSGAVQVSLHVIESGAPLWRSLGIGGGGAFYSASINPHNPDECYMATDMSAVFHSLNFGQAWNCVPFQELQGGHNTAIRFTSDPLIRYAVHAESKHDALKPVVTHNGGVHWTPLGADPTFGEVFSLWADSGSPNRIILSSYRRIYFSINSGQSFNQIFSNPSTVHVAGTFWNEQEIFIGTSDGLLYSQDNGNTFSLSPMNVPGGEAMVSFTGAKENNTLRFYCVTLDANNIWAGITGSERLAYRGVYRMDWGSGGWIKTVNGLKSNDYPFFMGMAENDLDTAYLAGEDLSTYAPAVYKTEDGGANWSLVFKAANNQNIATGCCGHGGDMGWSYGEYALGFAVCPSDPDRVLVTDMGYAHASQDGGLTWRQVYADPKDENPPGQKTPKGKNYGGAGLEDTSAWWLHFSNPSFIFAAFTDIRGIFSEDSGLTWRSGVSFGLPHNTTYHVVEHPVTKVLYAATSTVHDLYQSTYLKDNKIDSGDGRIIYSLDQGKNWQTLSNMGHPVVWLALDPNDPETLYASVVHSIQGGIYVTHNLSSGASWTHLSDPPRTEGHPFNIHVLNDGMLVGTWSGRRDSSGFTQSSGVFVSLDQGATWIDRSDLTYMTRWTKDIVIDPHDPTQNTWYVTVFSHWGAYPNEVGGLYRTLDRGLTWTRISDLYRAESITIHPIDPDEAYLTSEARGLWRTNNLTSSNPVFVEVDDYPFAHPVRTFFNPFNLTELWATSFGGGLFCLK